MGPLDQVGARCFLLIPSHILFVGKGLVGGGGGRGEDRCLSLSRPQLWPPHWGGGFLPILSRGQGRQEEPSGNVWLMERQTVYYECQRQPESLTNPTRGVPQGHNLVELLTPLFCPASTADSLWCSAPRHHHKCSPHSRERGHTIHLAISSLSRVEGPEELQVRILEPAGTVMPGD